MIEFIDNLLKLVERNDVVLVLVALGNHGLDDRLVLLVEAQVEELAQLPLLDVPAGYQAPANTRCC